jgi:hypothetical protein
VQPVLGNPVVTIPHAHDRHEAGIAHHIERSVRQFQRAAVGITVHGLELLFGHFLHAHSARMEGETLGLHARARAEHGGNLGLHRRVGARDDLADAE